MPKIFFSVGEMSGDLYASIIINELIKLNISPNKIFAIGGPIMKQTGIQIIKDIEELQVFGFAESVLSYFKIRKYFAEIKNTLSVIKPDIFVPVSFSGFNLPLIKVAKHIGAKVVYLGPPQLWAWGKFRVHSIKKYCDKVICLFPFEQKFYQSLGINALYFGNPLTEYVKSALSKQDTANALALNPELDWISFMPGSRPTELNHHLPLILQIIRQLQQEYPIKFEFLILTDKEIKTHSKIHFGTKHKYELMANSKLILLCSGTASIEATILNTPFIAFYKLSALNYLIAKNLLETPYFTLTNIIANKKIIQEFSKPNFNTLYNSIKHHLNNEPLLEHIRNELKAVRSQLILPKPANHIARAIINFKD